MQGQYSMFIALLPFLDPLMFYLAMRQNAETQAVTGAEKTAFAWFAALHSAPQPFGPLTSPPKLYMLIEDMAMSRMHPLLIRALPLDFVHC